MWKKIGKPAVVKADSKVIERFATMQRAPNDRDVRDRRKERLRAIMKAGTFRTCEWASAICKEDGVEYRVNGKHTSTILHEMNGDRPTDLYVVVEQYECDTLEDVARLYATFDTRESVKTTGDINKCFAGAHDDLSQLPNKLVNTCVSGLAFEKWEDGYFSQRAEDRAALILQHGDFAMWAFTVIWPETKDTRHLVRSPVLAAMFRTYKKSQKHAGEFWGLVRDGSGTDHRSPDRVLHKMLITSSVNTGRGAVPGRRTVAGREMYIKCIHAWNAWRKGVSTDLKYYPNAETPACV